MSPLSPWQKAIIAGAGVLVVGGVIYAATRPSASASSPENLLPEWRKKMLERARYHVEEGTPYQWGGGHTGYEKTWGLDCSGLIIDAAHYAGFVLEWNSNSMLALAKPVEVPEPGDVALYGANGKAVHVTMIEFWDGTAAGCIGSQGGDNTTTTPERALEQHAFVRRYYPHTKDTRFLGFRSLVDIAEGSKSGLVLKGEGFDETSLYG